MTNLVNLIDILVDKISNSTTEQEILFLSKSIEKLQLNKVRVVSNYYDMFDGIENNGDLYYVESETALYYSIYNKRVLLIEGGPSIYGWGSNTGGKLGDNTQTNRSSPVSTIGGFTDWFQVSAGEGHSLGVRSNGTAWAWGYNTNGQLGDNTTTVNLSPIPVVGGIKDWVQISAGASHNLALRANGTILSWGRNDHGQLGDDTIINKSSPVSVVGGFTDWIQIDGGGLHSLGIRSNGTAWAWGYNLQGQLGDGTTVSKRSPVSVVGGFTDWTQVSAAISHNLGIRSNGTAWAWGANTNGRLGDNTATGKSSPVSVVGGFTDWIRVSAGGVQSLGLRSNGTAWAWGYNTNGALGDGTTTSRSSPVSVIGGFTDWVQVSAGGSHSLGVRANGTAWAWGSGGSGQLGNNGTSGLASPVLVVGNFTDWIDVSGGTIHSMGLKTQ